MNFSPLHSFLVSQGAHFVEYCGWKVARDFGDPLAEYHAARNNLVLFDFSHLTKIRAAGADAKDYFHRRLSNRINPLKPGEGVQACLLQGNGKLLAELSVYAMKNELLLITSPMLRESFLEECRRFLITEDCEVSDVSAEYAILSLQGKQADVFVEQALGGKLYPQKIWHHVELDCCDIALTLIRIDLIGLPGFHLLIKAGAAIAAIDQIVRELRKFGGMLAGFETFQTLRIEAGQPIFGHELDREVLPPEARLTHTLDFDKGCYPGQEVMARMRNLGHPARLLTGLVLEAETPPPPGSAVMADDGEAGTITSSAFSPSLNCAIALAYLKWSHREPGPQLRVGGVKATIKPLPLVNS